MLRPNWNPSTRCAWRAGSWARATWWPWWRRRPPPSKRGMDLADFLVALKQMQAMGPMKQVLGLLPGVNAQALKAVNADDKRLKHVEAIVLSMTPDERADPSILSGSRRLRIAKGAGRTVQEVNRLLEQFQQMRKLLKRT